MSLTIEGTYFVCRANVVFIKRSVVTAEGTYWGSDKVELETCMTSNIVWPSA